MITDKGNGIPTGKVFHQFSVRGERYLAIPSDHGSVRITRDDGANFGGWQSIEGFKRSVLNNQHTVLGQVRVTYQVLP